MMRDVSSYDHTHTNAVMFDINVACRSRKKIYKILLQQMFYIVHQQFDLLPSFEIFFFRDDKV